jgi:hypothetical protein
VQALLVLECELSTYYNDTVLRMGFGMIVRNLSLNGVYGIMMVLMIKM